MGLKTLEYFSVITTAIAMSAGWAHLLALPNKIRLPADAYLTTQQVYRGWALLGVVLFAALLLTAILAVRLRHDRARAGLTRVAPVCIAASLVVFFSFTYPANQATQNWTMLPPDWEALRRSWEYSHAVNAILYFIALSGLTLSLLRRS